MSLLRQRGQADSGKVGMVELFFDLVFVFAVTQLSHTLLKKLDAEGALQVGEDELDTRMGKLITWHLARPPKPGSYSARLDIWLAPSLDWYPVQIRNTEGNGAVTTQTVTRIIK